MPLPQTMLYNLARRLENRNLVWEARGSNTSTVCVEGRVWNLEHRLFEKTFLLSTNGQSVRNYSREDLPIKWSLPETEEENFTQDDHWKE